MNEPGTFIKLDRKIVKWGWYKNANTARLFIHLLIKANWIQGDFNGVPVMRGQVATSLEDLSEELGLTISQIRTAISHLILTHEISKTNMRKYLLITIKNYDVYQDNRTMLAESSQDVSNNIRIKENKNYKNSIIGKKRKLSKDELKAEYERMAEEYNDL